MTILVDSPVSSEKNVFKLWDSWEQALAELTPIYFIYIITF